MREYRKGLAAKVVNGKLKKKEIIFANKREMFFSSENVAMFTTMHTDNLTETTKRIETKMKHEIADDLFMNP